MRLRVKAKVLAAEDTKQNTDSRISFRLYSAFRICSHRKSQPLVNEIHKPLARYIAAQIFAEEISHIVDAPMALPGHVWRDDDIGQIPQFTRRRQRFLGRHINDCAE